jgi:Flp pilus assembly protein TadB
VGLLGGAATFAVVWCMSARTLPLSRLGAQSAAEARGLSRRHLGERSPQGRSKVEDPRRRLIVSVAACMIVGWVLGGTGGAVVGVPAGVALSWWAGRLESPSDARKRDEIARDLPLAADLLAACVSVGRPVDDGLRLVSGAVGGALGERLDAVTARLTLGSDPVQEWRRAADDQQLAALARTMARTLDSGAPIGDALTRLAEDRRRERRTVTQVRARNVAVRAAGPLAACFLPAFMLIGIVPTVAGAFAQLVV